MLYQSLAQHYQEAIAAGRIAPGSRLPALRRLASQHAVSLTTAIKAYEHLQDGGWIVARPQAGFFVAEHSLARPPPSAPSFTPSSCKPWEHAPAGGYDANPGFSSALGIAMLAPELVNREALEMSIKRATRTRSDTLLHYPDTQGNLELRLALARHFQHDDLHFTEQELVITHGCLHAVRLAVDCVTQPGDAVAVSSPCFNGLLALLSAMSRRVVEIPLKEDGLNLSQLETLMQSQEIAACLFNTSHMNPSGTSLSPQQKQGLAELAARHRIPIIEDDVYLELSHQAKPPLPAKHWDKEGWILWCGSVSKTLAPGLRVGWCLPGRFLASFIGQHKSASYGVNPLLQLGLADFIKGGDYSKHINRLRPRLLQQARHYRQKLCAVLPNTARISQPEGGLVLWVQVPGLNAAHLSKEAAHFAIDLRSGASFSSLDYYRDCFRLNIGWPLYREDKQAPSQQAPTAAMQELEKLCELVNQQIRNPPP